MQSAGEQLTKDILRRLQHDRRVIFDEVKSCCDYGAAANDASHAHDVAVMKHRPSSAQVDGDATVTTAAVLCKV